MKIELVLYCILSSLSHISIMYCYKKYKNDVQTPTIFYDENRCFYKPLIDDEIEI